MKTILTFLIFLITLTSIIGQETKKCEKTLDSLTNSIVYLHPEVFPEPKMGQEGLTKNLMKLLEVDDEDFIDGLIDTEIVVGFVVNVEGKIIGERIISESPYKGLEKQLLGLIKKSEWKNGFCSDEAVDTYIEFKSIVFQKK